MELKRIKPTEQELEILKVMWDKGQATIREVHDVLKARKQSGYTTIKLMQLMFEKGLLERDTTTKPHVYKAMVRREQHQEQRQVTNTIQWFSIPTGHAGFRLPGDLRNE